MRYIQVFFFFQAEDGIRDVAVTGVQTCALPIFGSFLGGQQESQGAHLDESDGGENCRGRRVLRDFVLLVERRIYQHNRSADQRECQGPLTAAKGPGGLQTDRKSTRLNSSHGYISYA